MMPCLGARQSTCGLLLAGLTRYLIVTNRAAYGKGSALTEWAEVRANDRENGCWPMLRTKLGHLDRTQEQNRNLADRFQVCRDASGLPGISWVESRCGAVAQVAAYPVPALSSAGVSLATPCPVSTPRSSNRTCGFPASGFRTDWSRVRPRKVARTHLEPFQPKIPVQVFVWVA